MKFLVNDTNFKLKINLLIIFLGIVQSKTEMEQLK